MRSAVFYLLFPTFYCATLLGRDELLQWRSFEKHPRLSQILSAIPSSNQNSLWNEYPLLGEENYYSETLPGFSRDATQNIVLSEKNRRLIFYGVLSHNQGGATCGNDVQIINNPYGFYFGDNISYRDGGGIYAAGTCSIINNNNFWFMQNLAIGSENQSSISANYGGAIKAANCIISNNYGTCNFLNNIAATQGGAISSTTISITNNTGNITFKDNSVRGDNNGGALFATTMTISENTGTVVFANNLAENGGACYSTNNFSLTNNSGPVLFFNNHSFYKGGYEGGGGAIHSNSIIIENNKSPIIFSDNLSATNGGACYFTSLSIQNNGPITFFRNGACWGGAILCTLNSNLLISADYGDIIFEQNYALNPSSSSPLSSVRTKSRRNSMHLLSLQTAQLSARQGYSLKLYDPIEHLYAMSTPFLFNPAPYHQGTILFSGATVDKNTTEQENFFSYLQNTYELHNGVLAVEDNAGIACYQLLQQGGVIRLGQGGIVTTNTTASTNNSQASSVGSQITLNNIAINLPSIFKANAQPPKIWVYPASSTTSNVTTYTEDNNPTITLSGPLSVTNENNTNPYDSTDLSLALKRVPLLYLLDNSTPKIDITNLNVDALNSTTHYGYQGLWTPYWIETITTADSSSELTANTRHKILYADWTPVGYIPDPERQGDIVASALWQSLLTTSANLRSLSSDKTSSIFSASGHGLGLFIHQRGSKNLHGFHSHATGYSANTAATSVTNHKISLSFSQSFSRLKESQTHNTISSHDYFAGAKFDAPFFHEKLSTFLSLAYAYTSHKLTNVKASSALFHSHTLGSQFSLALSPQNVTRSLQTTPFATLQAIHASNEAFTEEGTYARQFSTLDPLVNLSMLLGVRSSWENSHHVPMLWELELAYVPTLYRQKPKISTMLLSSLGTWNTFAAPVAYNALYARMKSTAQIFDYMNISIQYSGEISSSTQSHFLQAGGQLQF
ncbi:polymorphic outer membrane protein middle domain-containing protein [Chlamydia pecorum]|uniref:polymorphic outer membrane protein middle domain-containing protein n=1 Tax=Chlamydia pecorum TaxID=85991 RepID=UPI0007AFA8F2|nr:polymorphic outer membrane protein middle domain-containing protein [Chlamydia pecorum]KZN27738.1 autotransporter beta-domain protein [Chlamydia pecorum]